MSELRFITAILFALFFLLLGCTRTLNINITEIGNYSQPLIEPLPINVGVYYENDFRTYKTVQENFFSDPFTSSQEAVVTRISKIQLGEANVALFDFILSHLFENLTSIQHIPNESENLKNIDLIVEPTISNYIYNEFPVSRFSSKIDTLVRIEYTINFHSPDDLLISTWTLSGESSRKIPHRGFVIFSSYTSSVELTQLAMREVAAQFFAGFCNQREIQKHFYEQCNQ